MQLPLNKFVSMGNSKSVPLSLRPPVLDLNGDGEAKLILGSMDLYWADDEASELESNTFDEQTLRLHKCKRCQAAKQTASIYCRACYESRFEWMPPWPTRAKAPEKYKLVVKKIKIKGHHDVPSHSNKSPQVSSDDGSAINYPQKLTSLMMLLKKKQRRYVGCFRHSNSGSSSDFDVIEDRKVQRLRRRKQLSRKKLKILGAYGTSSSSSSMDKVLPQACLRCEARYPNSLILHVGRTACRGLCFNCCFKIKNKNLPCPICGTAIDYVMKDSSS